MNDNQKRDREELNEQDSNKSQRLENIDNLPSVIQKENDPTPIVLIAKPTAKPVAKGIGGFKFNITTKVLPTTNEHQEEEEKNDESRGKIDTSSSIQLPSSTYSLNQPKKQEAKEDNSIVGPPRPKKKKNDDDDSSSDSDSDSSDSSDSDDDKVKNNNNIGPMVGPQRPVNNNDDSSDSDDDSSSSSSDDSEKEEVNRWIELARTIPISHEVVIKGHARAVSSVAFEPSGARLIAGSFDCKVKIWDFNGMDSNLRSFREIEPVEGAQVRSVLTSLSGDQFMVLPYTAQMKLFDRESRALHEYVSGDRYIQDLYHTKGHVSTLTGGAWHPEEREHFISSSLDSTIRVWDVNNPKKNLHVIRSRNSKGAKIGVISCTYDVRGDIIAGGCQDGSIIMFDQRSTLMKTKSQINNAHSINDVTSLVYARDGITLVSRGMDNTIKVWDLRTNLTDPLATFEDVTTDYIESNVILGSYDRLIVAGTSAKETGGYGTLVMYDRTSLTKMRQIKVDGASCINTQWNAKINQVAVGCSDGQIRVYYDPDRSEKGVRLCVNKVARKKDHLDYMPEGPVLTPNALPLFKTAATMRKHDTPSNKKSARPREQTDKPIRAGPNLTQHLVKNTGLVNDESWKQDARESFLSKSNTTTTTTNTNNNNNKK